MDPTGIGLVTSGVVIIILICCGCQRLKTTEGPPIKERFNEPEG